LYEHGQRRGRRAWITGGVSAAAIALLASACTSGTGSTPPQADPTDPATAPAGSSVSTPSSAPTTSKSPDPIVFTAAPVAKAGVNPTTPITLSVANGTLRTVNLINGEGKRVPGTLSKDRTSWHANEVLGYSKTYKLTAKATNSTGEATRTYKHAFTTLTPGNMTMPYLDDIYGSALASNGKYGIAMVPVVNFDETITRKAVAERHLIVTTSPHVDGSWYWASDHSAHWRPEHYLQPGTKVTVTAKVYGVEVGDGLYGESDASKSYKIGRKQITMANDTAPASVNKVRVYRNNHLVRTMNTSMGEHTGEKVNGQWINFYTLDGTYTVLGFENPAHMCSDSYGLPANAPGGYGCEDIPWSTKISVDGIYLHELDATTWAQNSGQDVSHGCLNLDYDNAHWFYTHSLVGDPVVIHGAKGAPHLQLWQGGDWSMSWSDWLKGSALHHS
jgi:lipoprotein-anchoring transpeptidase ErfK/SrfK